MDQRLKNLDAKFKILEKANLKVSISKMCLARPEVDVLGHRVGAGALGLTPSTSKQLRRCVRPKTQRRYAPFWGR